MAVKTRLSRREFLRLSTFVVTGTMVAACMPVTTPSQEGTGAAGAEPVTVRYTFVADPGELEIRQKAVDEFQSQNANIKINAELIPEDGMAEKIVTMVAGGAAPDVVYVHPSFVPLFATQNVLLPLDDFAQADPTYDASDFYETVVAHFVRDGKTYGYPYYSGPLVTFFNKTLFDQAGEPYPSEYTEGFKEGSDDWTWDKALEVAMRMTKGEGADKIFGNWPISMSLHWFDSMVWSFGGELWTEDMTKCLLTEPAAMDAIQYQADTIMKYNAAPLPQQTEGMPGGFTSGHVAMQTSGIKAHVPGIVEAGLDVGVAPVPIGPSGRVTRDGPNALGILSTTQNPDASWAWVKFMSGPEPGDPGGMKFEFELHRALPTRKSLYDAPEFVDNLLPWEDLDVYRNASESVRALTLPSRYGDVNSAWVSHWEAILAGSMSVEEAVQAACEEIDQLLAE